jgi:hypothetical protein
LLLVVVVVVDVDVLLTASSAVDDFVATAVVPSLVEENIVHNVSAACCRTFPPGVIDPT